MYNTGDIGASTIAQKTRISRPGNENGQCAASRHPVTLNAFCLPLVQFVNTSARDDIGYGQMSTGGNVRADSRLGTR